jgi:hypothetical protein
MNISFDKKTKKIYYVYPNFAYMTIHTYADGE